MKEFWNERYSKEEFIYGKEPNKFLQKELSTLKPGKILFLGEGEGRNAVYAATLGWQVDAVDSSDEGKKKALLLANDRNVAINYIVADIFEHELLKEHYDVIVLIYVHVHDDLKPLLHNIVIDSLKSSGRIILEAFEKGQIKNTSGGPKDIDLLYDLRSIAEDFIDLDFEKLGKETVFLTEGNYHSGKAEVVRFVGVNK